MCATYPSWATSAPPSLPRQLLRSSSEQIQGGPMGGVWQLARTVGIMMCIVSQVSKNPWATTWLAKRPLRRLKRYFWFIVISAR